MMTTKKALAIIGSVFALGIIIFFVVGGVNGKGLGATLIQIQLDACPNISGIQTVVPAGYTKDRSGNCVTTVGTCNTYQFVTKWGGQGNGDGQFFGGTGITIDSSGNVYATDQISNRVQKFTSGGQYLGQWGSSGVGNGQFDTLWGVDTDSSGNVYLADYGNHRVQKFTSNGTYITQFGTSMLPVVGVAVDNSGYVYVTGGASSNHVQKFTSNGTFVTQFGATGSGNGQFLEASAVATDLSGNVYVTDPVQHRVQKFSSSGVYLTQWGVQGSGNGQFITPLGIATDSSGNVYVTDYGNHRVQKFTSTGTYVTQFGTRGSGDGQLAWPQGITVDSSGNVYVADTQNQRIQKFSPNCKTAEPVLQVSPIVLPNLTKDFCPNISGIQSSVPTGYVVDPSGNCVKQVIITPTTLQNSTLLTATSTLSNETCNTTTAPWIKVISPNGGEVYRAGQQVEVKWKSCNYTEPNISIALAVPNINNFKMGIGLFPNTGIATITLPTQTTWLQKVSQNPPFPMPLGLKYKFVVESQVWGTYFEDYSDNLFTINQ